MKNMISGDLIIPPKNAPGPLSCGCVVKNKRDKMRCSQCGKYACPKHTFSRVDESNAAITKNAPLFCANCAEDKE